MKRRVYVYQENLAEELKLFFSELSKNIQIENIENDIITLFDDDYYNEEPIDLESFQMLLVEDFDSMVTIIIEPYLEEDFELGISLKEFIKELPHNVYFLEDIITYVVLNDNKALKSPIK